MQKPFPSRTRAQESRSAIQRLYVAMRHLFIQGNYKPLSVSGEAIIEAMQTLQPEIYGTINDPEKVELKGLLYIFDRLPKGIEECRYIKLIGREGYENSNFQPIVPAKRRRNCYRIDEEQMQIEMTRGRSDIYDVLTHLTFMYIEAEKIRRNSLDHNEKTRREWFKLEKIIEKENNNEPFDHDVAYTYLSTLLGRSFKETIEACNKFKKSKSLASIFHITYWLGKLSMEEYFEQKDREISFSSVLRENIGQHIYGELWAFNIKKFLEENDMVERPIHIISANLHSVMNVLYATKALKQEFPQSTVIDIAESLSVDNNASFQRKVKKLAQKEGLTQLDDQSGMNISVQIFDLEMIDLNSLPEGLNVDIDYIQEQRPVIIVMDYAFGEQAFETLDELLKPLESGNDRTKLNVESISIMGKAGTLTGKKGDILIPSAHVFEGTADNYPIENQFEKEDFLGNGLEVFEGPMITVLGTSLQNKDILRYFKNASWKAVGLEMEGAHYQKAIQSASKVRKSIRSDVTLRYAYYASDNPLISGQTLASGSLGLDGVKPTYLITIAILNKLLTASK